MLRCPKALILTLLFCLWPLLSGCVTPENTQKRPETGGFLWEAVKAEERLSLVGTMHVGINPEDMSPELWKRLHEADAVIIEADLNQIDQGMVRRYLLLAPGQDLAQMLGMEYFDKFLSRMARFLPSLNLVELRRMSPLWAGTQLMMADAQEALNPDGSARLKNQQSIDQIIFDRAKALGKSAKTFEQVGEQLELLQKAISIDDVKQMLDSSSKQQSDISALQAAFRKGDQAAIEILMQDLPQNLRTELIDRRNQRWVQRLPQLKGKAHTLIAVGAAHFGGEQSLLKLLEAEGYTIKSAP